MRLPCVSTIHHWKLAISCHEMSFLPAIMKDVSDMCRMRICFSFFLILIMPGINGCAPQQYTVDTAWPEPRPLGAGIKAYTPPAEVLNAGPEEATDLECPIGPITLRQALSLSLMKNPALASSAWEVRAGEAKTLQSGLRSNPTLGAQVGNTTQSGAHPGHSDVGDTAEVDISQVFELGNKRAKKTRVAILETSLAGWDYEAKRLDVITETSKAFVDVLAAQELLALNTEMERTSGELFVSASKRNKEKAQLVGVLKAKADFSTAKLQKEQAVNKLEAARKRLAGSWCRKTPTFEKAEGIFAELRPIPSLDELVRFLYRNPDVARWAKEIEQRFAVLALEKAKTVPDVTLSGGAQESRVNNGNAFVFGASVPLPLFDQNQGNILAARYKLEKAGAESRDALIKAGTALGDAYQTLASSYRESKTLKKDLMPVLERIANSYYKQYQKDGSGLSEVIDTRRALFEARVKCIEVISAYHKSRIDIERLIGGDLYALVESKK